MTTAKFRPVQKTKTVEINLSVEVMKSAIFCPTVLFSKKYDRTKTVVHGLLAIMVGCSGKRFQHLVFQLIGAGIFIFGP